MAMVVRELSVRRIAGAARTSASRQYDSLSQDQFAAHEHIPRGLLLGRCTGVHEFAS